MSDTTDSSPSPVRRINGCFVKGNPDGPGRPRGFVVRRHAAPQPIACIVVPEPGRDGDCVELDRRRRITAIEATVRDLERQQVKCRQNGFRRFSDGFGRFPPGHRARKSQQTQSYFESMGTPAV